MYILVCTCVRECVCSCAGKNNLHACCMCVFFCMFHFVFFFVFVFLPNTMVLLFACLVVCLIFIPFFHVCACSVVQEGVKAKMQSSSLFPAAKSIMTTDRYPKLRGTEVSTAGPLTARMGGVTTPLR